MADRLSEALRDNADLAAKLSNALRDLADTEARVERVEFAYSSIFDRSDSSRFDAWASSELAIQCRMQARDTSQWDTEDSKNYAAFMLAVAKRLEGGTSDEHRQFVAADGSNVPDRPEQAENDVADQVSDAMVERAVEAYEEELDNEPRAYWGPMRVALIAALSLSAAYCRDAKK